MSDSSFNSADNASCNNSKTGNLSFGISAILDGSNSKSNTKLSSPKLFHPYSPGNFPCWPMPSFFAPQILKFPPTLPYEHSCSMLNQENENRRDKRPGHPYQNRAPAKHKKPRTSFTKSQVAL